MTLQTVPDSTELTRLSHAQVVKKKKRTEQIKKELTAMSETAPKRAVSKTDESGVSSHEATLQSTSERQD